jgi:C4-dicarboxylate transporter DctM subunit
MTALALVVAGIVVLILWGLPVGFAFALGCFALGAIYNIDLAAGANVALSQLNSFAMLALPLYIFLGTLMSHTGLATRLIDFVDSIVGRVRGGLGLVLIISNAIFGAISGVAASALATMGTIMIPEMERFGYPRSYSICLAVCASVLSLLIPPSITMIIFGLASRQSIPLLFAATFIPGLILTTLLCLVHLVLSRSIPTIAVPPKISFTEQGKNVARLGKKAFFTLMLPVVILGGLYSGIFTPTEAAIVAIVYALIIGFFVYRILTPKTMWKAAVDAGRLTGTVVIILFFFLILSHILILNEVPQLLGTTLMGLSSNKIVFLIFLNIVLLILGMFMDDISSLLLAAIIFLPVARLFDVHPLHFGAICCINLGMGLITPPVAPLLYLGAVVADVPVKEFVKPVFYMLIFAYLPAIIITTYIPEISLTLPRLIMEIWR